MLNLIQDLFYDVPMTHILIELLLVLLILKFVFFTKKTTIVKREKLTDKEEDELIREWEPEPLVASSDEPIMQSPTVEGVVDTHVTIDGEKKLNLASYNFLGLYGDKQIEDVAIKTIHSYGVGSCGPRGFYGTVDVHLDLERELAEFLGTEEAIIYSYGFSTIASAVPAYAKRGDVLFCDKALSFPTQRGLIASRSDLKFFDHNNMEHLEKLLQAQAEEDRLNPTKARSTRCFIVVEGVYANTGSIAPLKKLVELKYKYKVRLIVEESCSFGVLGKTGRGLTEYSDVSVDDVDIIVGSLETSLGSIGGFAAGRSYVIDHQRLSGQGYCFSASLPPFLATSASAALARIASAPALDQRQVNMTFFRNQLKEPHNMEVVGDLHSPLVHLRVKDRSMTIKKQESVLDSIVKAALSKGVAITRAAYVHSQEIFPQIPSIRLIVSAAHDQKELKHAAEVLREAATSAFSS